MSVSVLCLFLTVPWVGMQCVISISSSGGGGAVDVYIIY